MDFLTEAKGEVGVSRHLPITHLNSRTVFETKNGEVGSVLRLSGIPFDTATPEELNHFKAIKHQAISTLGEDFGIVEHTIRKKRESRLKGAFQDPFTESVDQCYHQQFKDSSFYENTLYLTVIHKGVTSGKMGKSVSFLEKMSHKSIKLAKAEYRIRMVDALENAVKQLSAKLSLFNPYLLGDNEKQYSELLAFFGNFINGLGDHFYRFETTVPNYQAGMHFNNVHYEKYPSGNLAHYIPRCRLFIGKTIQIQKSEKHLLFGSMITLRQYGQGTSSIMLNALMQLDCEWIQTNSFFIETNETAQKKIEKQWIRMQNANDPAYSQMQALSECQDSIASGNVKVGYHHHSLMLISENQAHLSDMLSEAIKRYADIGISASVESIGLEAAFWAQIPGNQKYIVRSSLITSENYVDFTPLHNYFTGYINKNHLGSAVTLIETPSKTPLYFNFHARGSGNKNDLTPGHATIIGGNGCGKTVFMGFMDSQMSRYGGRSYFFDRDRGMELYVRATGGQYTIIGPDSADDCQFNPFQLSDTPSNRQFLASWLAELMRHEGEEQVPAGIGKQLYECVSYAFESLEPSVRKLSTVTRLLPIDFPRWDELNRWIVGPYRYLFENDHDALSLEASKVGFDMTELLQQPKNVMNAVSMYLVHCIKHSLKGDRVSLYFDEGWQILDNPYWKDQLKKDLPTLRKLNAHIVLATQSPESVLDSSLSAQFLDNCATSIFFCNEKANYEKHYRHFNLNESEFEFLKKTPKEQRLFLYKQSSDSAIGKLNLSGMDDCLAIYSGNKSTVTLADKIRKVVGDNPCDWLPVFHEKRKGLYP